MSRGKIGYPGHLPDSRSHRLAALADVIRMLLAGPLPDETPPAARREVNSGDQDREG